MPIVITTKQGTPLKLTDRFLIRPAVSPITIKSPVPIPPSMPTSLSKPEAPTTTNIRQMESNIPFRHSVLYQRMADRGGSLPFQGKVETLPNDKIGGARNRIAPVLMDIAKQTKNIIPGNSRVAQKLQTTIRRTAMLQDIRKKIATARITPGPSALDFAQAPRRFVETRTNQIGMRAAIPLLRKKGRGVFSQHRTAPAATVNRLAAISARKPQSLISARLRQIIEKSKQKSENPSIPVSIKTTDEATSIAAPYATEVVKEERGFERFAFLAAVAVIGYLALKRG